MQTGIVLFPDGARFSARSLVGWSISSSTVTVVTTSNGASPYTYSAASIGQANMILELLDAWYQGEGTVLLNIVLVLVPLMFIASITPDVVGGSSPTVTIAGQNFIKGMSVMFLNSVANPGVTKTYATTFSSSASVTITYTNGDLPAGTYDTMIFFGSLAFTLPQGFIQS